jgi:hypothetical protein
MPIGLRLNFPENTIDDYDKICKALNFPADWPDGLIAHGSHDVDGHLGVSDVWESRGHFDRFAEGRLQKAMGEAMGDRARAPEITERDFHSFYSREVGQS